MGWVREGIRKNPSIGILMVLLVLLFFINFLNPRVMNHTFPEDLLSLPEDQLNDFSSEPDITSFVTRVTEGTLVDAIRSNQEGKITESQLGIIIEGVRNAREELSNGNKMDSLQISARLLAYRDLYPFVNCAENITEIIKQYNPFFYYMSKSDKEKIIKIQKTSSIATQYLEDFEEYTQNNQTIFRRSRDAQKIKKQLDLYELNCEGFKSYLESDYQYQRNWFYLKSVAFIGIALIFYLIGRGSKKKMWQSFFVKSNTFIEKITRIFHPIKIGPETIKSIITISPVTTTLVSFIAVAVSVSSLNNPLVIWLILLSVMGLLSSLLFGIVSINTDEEIYKRICYTLFLAGILLFVGFFLAFLISGSFISVIQGTRESLREFILNNQTVTGYLLYFHLD